MTGPERRNVTINGTNFSGGSVTSRSVLLNGVNVGSLSVSATRLVFTVPVGAISGPITVQTNLGSVSTATNFIVGPGTPPANDNFANALPLSGASGSFIGNTANATKEAGEPNHAGDTGGASVWFTWTAPSSGPYLFNPHDTTATNFGVDLAIYTGTAVNNLTPIVAAASGIPFSRYQSAVVLNATAGTTYYIAIDGFTGIMGDYKLVWSPLTAPTVTSFSPTAVYAGQQVVVLGTGFAPGASVLFGSVQVQAAKLSYVSPTQITVTQLPPDAVTAPVTVITQGGTGVSAGSFVVNTAPPPTINSFSPSSGLPGGNVTISGVALSLGGPPPTVLFNGAPVTTFNTQTSTSLSVRVPNSATTGPISVQTTQGSATSTNSFTVIPPPLAVTGFTPTSGPAGSTVTLTGTSLSQVNQVLFNGAQATFTVDSSTQITATVPVTATTGQITISDGSTITSSAAVFTVTSPPLLPTITGFSPAVAAGGENVVITGTNFIDVANVTFNGVGAGYHLDSDTQITAFLPADPQTSGLVAVTTAAGTATSTTNFTYRIAPTIIGFSPGSFFFGNTVSIAGTDFNSVSDVSFGGVSVPFTVSSSSQIYVTVPASLPTSGFITVTTPGGTATSTDAYTFIVAPAITSFSPTAIAPGVPVTITGTNFVGITSVAFNGFNASFTVISPTQIIATAPTVLNPGPISVTNSTITTSSATSFTVSLAPFINSVTPTSGPEKRIITVSGANFSGTGISSLQVRVNGTPIGSFSSSSTSLTFAVPTGATTGPITVSTSQGLATSSFNFVVAAGPPPANDNFANAQVITGTSGVFSGNTANATKEPGEPNHAGNAGGASVWFTWTAPQSGLFLFNPYNSSSSQFGIIQSIYTGNDVASLTLVASGLTPTNVFARYGSAAVLNAVSGTTYRIALDGYNGVMADYKLSWSPLSPSTVTGFSPSAATAGQTITVSINGTNFTPGSTVSFGGGLASAAKITYQSANLITVSQVPITAVTGPITIITPAGTASSTATFFVTPPAPPTITGFSPSSGTIGNAVTITGSNFAGTSAVLFNGVAASSFTVDTAGQNITTSVPNGATSGFITVVAPGGTATSTNSFITIQPPPTISGFSPTSITDGTSVVISGTGFTNVLGVNFNGVSAASFTVDSAAQITAVVPVGPISNGPISVMTASGTATSAASFTYLSPATPPTITSFSPTAIAAGLPVTITGTNFVNVSSVTFNGTTSSFTVSSPTQIVATAPSGLTAGAIAVTSDQGTGTSTSNYTITLAPIITSATPSSGPEKRVITVRGANFSGTGITTPVVKVNGTSIGAFSVSSNFITFAVPVGATTGPITIQTSQGTATSPFNFIVAAGTPPDNDNFANAQLLTGVSGAVTGSNTNATKEPGEPNHAGNAGGASVWFTWTAPQSGLFLFNPYNSSSSEFGIIQSIYTGNDVASLTLVASGLTPTGSIARYGSAAVLNAVSGTTYRIALDGVNGLMADYQLSWSPLGSPTVGGFSPAGATAGQTITISIFGSNFTPGSTVSFGGGLATPAKITYQNPNLITVTQIPITAVTGPITIVTPAGAASSSTNFLVTPPPAPTITTFSPSAAAIGANVTITGSNFAGTSSVLFNGVAAPSFTVDTAGQNITTSVPNGASTGFITVSAPGGSATSVTTFTVIAPPIITQQPQAQTVTFGQAASFTVAANSATPLTFSWRKNGIALAGVPTADTATLTLPSTILADAGAYDCVVVNNAGSVVSIPAALTVNPAPAIVTLGSLSATFDGSPKPVSVATNPAGLAVQVTYDGVSSPPMNAGSYTVIATVTDANYTGSATGTLVVNKASAAVALTGLTATYNTAPHAAGATTIPSGLNVSFTYDNATAAPSNAGTYNVIATVNDTNYIGSATGTLSIAKASASVTLSGLTATYDGTAHAATVVTAPSSLNVSLTYDGATAAPINAGTYAVSATVNDANYTGSASGSLSIAKAAGVVTLGNLTATFDGAPKPATATTLPSNLGVQITYNGVTTAPANAGSYAVVATISDPNYTGATTGSLVIGKASATIVLSSLTATYDGAAHAASATTAPAGLTVDFTYDGGAAAPTNAGSYTVVAIVNDQNYVGSATDVLTIAKATAAITLNGLSQTYDGSPKSVTASTNPNGLPVGFAYNGSATPPTNVGSYTVVATVNHANYSGSASGTLTIAKQSAVISLGDLVQAYDGEPRSVTVTTTPASLKVDLTYNGSTTAPTNPGTYTVLATVDDPNLSGTASASLLVTIPALVRHAPSLNGGLDGSLQILLGEDVTLNGNAYLSGDLLVPGTPSLRLNGHPTLVGTRDGGGNASPSNYQVTLSSNSVIRYLVDRVDAIAIPSVTAPPLPTGTRDVVLNSAGQSPGDFATILSLTLNGNTGQLAVPAGTYANLNANSGSGFTFGIPGATTPAIYNLQNLTLNGNSQIQIVGPVVLNLANGLSINGQVGDNAHPEWVTINVATGGVTLNGNASLHGYIIAPNGSVTINGNSTLHGGVASDRLTINGGGLLTEAK